MKVQEKLSRADLIDLHKARVEACLEDYRQGVLQFAEFMHALHMKQQANARTDD